METIFSDAVDFPSPLGRTGGIKVYVKLEQTSEHGDEAVMYYLRFVVHPYDNRRSEVREVEHKRLDLYYGAPTLKKLRYWVVGLEHVLADPFTVQERAKEIRAFLAGVAAKVLEGEVGREAYYQALNAKYRRKDTESEALATSHQDEDGEWIFAEVPA